MFLLENWREKDADSGDGATISGQRNGGRWASAGAKWGERMYLKRVGRPLYRTQRFWREWSFI